jgi:hypothetical protein
MSYPKMAEPKLRRCLVRQHGMRADVLAIRNRAQSCGKDSGVESIGITIRLLHTCLRVLPDAAAHQPRGAKQFSSCCSSNAVQYFLRCN